MRTAAALCLLALALAPAAAAAGTLQILDRRPPPAPAWPAPAPGAFAEGEARLLSETLAEPLALLELAEVPPELLAVLTIHRLGPIHGPHATDVPRDTALAVAALTREPVPAAALRSYTMTAEVRNEEPWRQREDLAAMLSGEDG